MRKLLFVLLAFFAVFTFINAFDAAQASETAEKSVEITR